MSGLYRDNSAFVLSVLSQGPQDPAVLRKFHVGVSQNQVFGGFFINCFILCWGQIRGLLHLEVSIRIHE